MGAKQKFTESLTRENTEKMNKYTKKSISIAAMFLAMVVVSLQSVFAATTVLPSGVTADSFADSNTSV